MLTAEQRWARIIAEARGTLSSLAEADGIPLGQEEGIRILLDELRLLAPAAIREAEDEALEKAALLVNALAKSHRHGTSSSRLHELAAQIRSLKSGALPTGRDLR